MSEKLSNLSSSTPYRTWIDDIKQRYLSARLKASTAVNQSLLSFYWTVGEDIAKKQFANIYGSSFYDTLSRDLKKMLPDVKGLSPINLHYMYRFYVLYSEYARNLQQPVEDLKKIIFSIPWSHNCRIIDKCKGDGKKALFFVKKTLEHNWGRDILLHWLGTNLYEREGNAVNNFTSTLPAIKSDLARQITRDPYNFDFLSLREDYDEKELETALVDNVVRFLLELGNGFAFVGRQIRLKVGSEEFFPDLLFYNIKIHAYVVIELKTTKFSPSMLGQLSFYTAVVDGKMKSELDNPTIGLLICKSKNDVIAQYSLERYNAPIGISQYELSQLYPEEFKGTLPTIEEIESELKDQE